ncbi:hypothetical protein BD626DRAFT_480747 [Schizophyllum amplum]|uniref:Spo12 family-domain-containing protein n=1 Tax=Schizophyllum amplum TaxID=97359 RepID=A0A550CTG5_9AGAR|nr:hypothetical protein BD626DRAFT_480747 [Auriculariopsis ampla]
MSSASTPNDSPASVQPLHNPSQAAKVVLPQAPLGNVLNQAPGMGAKALLARRMPKAHNASYVSPTDNMMTPCSQKLNSAKKKQFTKAKPTQLFAAPQEQKESEGEDEEDVAAPEPKDGKMDVDDDNPF